MANELMTYEQKPEAIVEQKRGDYYITVPGVTEKKFKLTRGVDFGIIKNKKGEQTVPMPFLWKSGSEAIFKAYGVFADYITESAIERVDKDPLFYYRVKCELYTYVNGERIVVGSGLGSANTAEKRNGFNGPFDAANGALKQARKRSGVDAAINLAGLSSLFYQDEDNINFMDQANDLAATLKEDAPITAKQLRRIWALAANVGLNANEAKNKIVAAGFASTKDIKQKDYEKVCKLFEENDGAEVHS